MWRRAKEDSPPVPLQQERCWGIRLEHASEGEDPGLNVVEDPETIQMGGV